MINFLKQKRELIKYIISGGTAAVVNISTLYILVDYFDLWYLASSTLAYLVAFFVSFTLQKFWTFLDKEKRGTTKQAIWFILYNVISIFINMLFVFVFVEVFGVVYLVAQILSGIIIAGCSFFVYRSIFSKK